LYAAYTRAAAVGRIAISTTTRKIPNQSRRMAEETPRSDITTLSAADQKDAEVPDVAIWLQGFC